MSKFRNTPVFAIDNTVVSIEIVLAYLSIRNSHSLPWRSKTQHASQFLPEWWFLGFLDSSNGQQPEWKFRLASTEPTARIRGYRRWYDRKTGNYFKKLRALLLRCPHPEIPGTIPRGVHPGPKEQHRSSCRRCLSLQHYNRGPKLALESFWATTTTISETKKRRSDSARRAWGRGNI